MQIYQPTQSNEQFEQPHRKPPWRIALIANQKDKYQPQHDDPPDMSVEFDTQETIEALAAALEADGHWVYLVQGDHTLPEALINLRPHICFNIAEGIRGDGREAQAPALCELLGIPYTGSQVVTNAIALHKTHTKRIWQQLGLQTAPYYEFNSLDEVAHVDLRFPLIVKPANEGASMGVDARAVVDTHTELLARVDWVLNAFRQPALVEEFLPGREFTVGFIGNPGNPSHRAHPDLYDSDGYHWFPVLEIDTLTSASPTVYGHQVKAIELGSEGAPQYLCPADIPGSLRARLIDLTRQAAQALKVRDIARVDFRMGADGEPYLLEINILPGLNPNLSNLCIMAATEGMAYPTLITEILYLAAERYGLPFEPRDTSRMQAATAKVPVQKSDPAKRQSK
jgi:D-alanine--D-alanine ligase